MKRHSMFVATTLAGALAIATPAVAGDLLGGITGGAGAAVLGTAGGALNPMSNFGAGNFSAAGMLGGASQFQGQIMQSPLTIQRPVLPVVSPNLGAGATGEIGSSISIQNRSVQATGGAFAGGGASAGPASFGAEGATQAQVRAGF